MALIGNVSGSLTHLTDGTSYLIAGSGVTLTSGSGDSVTIASSAGSVAGSDTQMQYNNGSAFGGAADLTFNDSTGDTTVGASTSDAKLLFRDTGNYIWSEADGDLEVINNDGTGNDSLKLTSTSGGIIIDAGKTGAGVLLLTSSHAAGGVKIDAGTGDLDLNSDDAVDIDADGALSLDGAGGINIGTAADVAFDIDTAALDIDSSGAVTIDTTGIFSVDVTSTTSDSNIKSAAGVLVLESGKTGAAALLLSSSHAAGGIKLAAGTGDLDINSDDAITLDAHGVISLDAEGASNFTTTGGTLTLSGSSGVNVMSTGGNILASVAAGSQINLGTMTACTVDVGGATATEVELNGVLIDVNAGSGGLTMNAAAASNLTTSAGAITIDSVAAGLVLDGHTGVDIDASNSGKVSIDGAGGIDIGVAADVAIDIDSATLDIDASGAITIDGTSTVSIQGAGATDLTTSSGALTLSGQSLDIDATSGAFNIGGTAASTVTTSGGALSLDGQTGVNIQEDGTTVIAVDTSRNVTIGNATSAETIRIGHTVSELTIGDNMSVTGDASFVGDMYGSFLKPERGGSLINITSGSTENESGDIFLFVSGAATPLGSNVETTPRRVVFGGDVIYSGSIRGGFNVAAQQTLLSLRANKTVIGSGVTGLTGATSGPGGDTTLYLSGTVGGKASGTGVTTFGGDVVMSGSLVPGVDNSKNLGSATQRWANIYTGDLHLQNDRGNWTVIEESDYLSLRNNKSGKTFKLLMEEITE